MRDAEKINVFAAEKVDVINAALTIEGRTEQKVTHEQAADGWGTPDL